MRDPSSTVSVDHAWSDLRYHLEWTRNEPTVVIVAAQTRAQTQDLKERAALWCRRVHESWTEPEPEQLLNAWLSRHLPVPGVLFLDLWDDQVRRRVLHALNEMRIRLARPGGGCVMVCGSIALLGEASREAADLWSIRSLTCVIGSSSGELMDRPKRREEDDRSRSVGANDGSRYRSAWSITVPPDQRTPELAVTIRETDRARRLLPTEPWRAREILDSLPEDPSPLAVAFRGLTRAEIGGLLDDTVTVEVNLKAVLETLAGFPAALRFQVADAVLDIAMTFDAVDAAVPAVREHERLARGLEESLGTPEARRLLSVALDNVGRVAEAQGEWDAAEAAYRESLDLARGLEESLGTPEARRDLSVALDNVGRVAEAQGEWDAAEAAYRESLDLARGLEESLGTPQARRDLSVALDNVGRVAEARGDWDAAQTAYLESLELARELEDLLGTPQARRDLAISLDNVGRAARDRGDWDAAEAAFQESLKNRRELETLLGTPQAQRDVSTSEENLKRLRQKRADLGEL